MKRKNWLAVAVLLVAALSAAGTVSAGRVRVVHRGHRTRVVVHRGFPLRRTLPHVVVRTPHVAVRVEPRVFLPPVVFGAVVLTARPAPAAVVWHQAETLDHDDEWVDFTLNADRRGSRLYLAVDEGAARINFAEVVFENGDAQVVDFNEKVYAPGYYSLLDFKDGRKVDHVRLVASADAPTSSIAVSLVG